MDCFDNGGGGARRKCLVCLATCSGQGWMKLATGVGVRVWPARISERRQVRDSCETAGVPAKDQLHPRTPGGFASPHHSEQHPMRT